MGLFRKAALVVIVGVVLFYVLSPKNDLPRNFGGHVDPGFEEVETIFRQNFADGLEPEGAAFAVCYRGKMVVDLWGGYADTSSARPWKRDTTTVAFSTTKAVAALVIAILVDRGQLDYSQLVTKYWPEFGKHGKANVTVETLVNHKAGLVALDSELSTEVLRDWKLISALFENQVPNWPPGTVAGYHMITFGFLCDQLVRRVDPQGRSLGKFFHEEVAIPFGIDFYIGLPRDQTYRIARMRAATFCDTVKRLGDWDFVQFMVQMMTSRTSPIMEKAMQNAPWLGAFTGILRFNDPELLEVEIAAANGVGTARALAQLFCLLDGTKLMKKDTVKKISLPTSKQQLDKMVTQMNISWSWGFTHEISPAGSNQFGHPGYGGQQVNFNPQERLAFAYLRNHMAPDMGPLTITYKRLERAVYKIVSKIKS